MRRISWMVLGVVALVVAVPAAAQECIDSDRIAQGPLSGFDPSPRCEGGACPGLDTLITDADTWSKTWKNHTSNVNPAPPLPAVDFREQVVIATFMGKRPTSHHQTTVECVEDSGLIGGNAWIASIVEESPGTNCIVNQVITNPFDFVVLDRPTGIFPSSGRVSVTFQTTELVIGCGGGDPICRVCGPGGGIGGNGGLQNPVPCCP